VFKCYKRFDPSYVGEEKVANVAHSYGVDSIWYVDSGATDHVTRDLDRLVVRNMYNSTDQIYTASGPCMHIKHIGHSVIHTPGYDLSLINILHVPKSSKNLVSVHRITSNNNVFFELHPNFFIKDWESRKTLLESQFKGGLYPLPCNTSTSASSKHAFRVSKVSTLRWHARLGHSSLAIVRFVLSKNSLPFFLGIGSRGKLFWKASLREDSTLSLAAPPLQLHPNKLLVLARSPHQDGMLV
jgi:hypothetical protein